MSDDLQDLDDFGRKPSAVKRLVYLLLSLECVVAVALLYIRIFLIDISASQVTLALGIIVCSVVLSLAYHNLAFAKAARIRLVANPPTKNAFKGNQQAYKAAQLEHEQTISRSALWYSCAYNNAIFMFMTPVIGCYVLSENVGGDLNLLLSGAAAAALALFNSNTALKAIGE